MKSKVTSFTPANIWAQRLFKGLVWLGEPEPAQAGGRSGADAQAPFGQPADLSETSHHQRQARSAREEGGSDNFEPR